MRQVHAVSLRHASIYAFAAMLWIVVTDQLADRLADQSQILTVQTSKGLLFVAVTAAILYAAEMRHQQARLRAERLEVELARTTDKRARDESETHYRRMVDEAVVGMLRTSADGTIEQANFELARMLGYESPEELLANVDRVQDLYVHPDDRERLLAELRSKGRVHEFQTDFRRSDGSTICIATSVRAVLDADSTMLGVEGVVADISDRIRTQQALQAAYEHERQAAERLQEVSRTQDVLLTAVSHELRTPLTSILGFAETLQRHADNLGPERQADLADRIAKNATRLNRMLTGLLDLDRLRRGIQTAQPRPVRLRAFVQRTVGSVDTQPRVVHIQVPDVTAWIDPAIAERILEDLLANVARHTPPSTRVWVGAHLEGDALRLIVDDDGPGVPDTRKETVFTPFQRADDDQPNPSAGVGLARVQRLAQLHEGSCWVEDRAGGGASFGVQLRMAGTDPPDDRLRQSSQTMDRQA